jgi:hypothetical protein
MENINLENVLNLMNSVDIDSDSDLASNDGSPAPLGRKCKKATSAKGTVQEKIETARGFLASMLNKDPKETAEDKEKSLMTVVNSIVKVVSKVWDTVMSKEKRSETYLRSLLVKKRREIFCLMKSRKDMMNLKPGLNRIKKTLRPRQDKQKKNLKLKQTRIEKPLKLKLTRQ